MYAAQLSPQPQQPAKLHEGQVIVPPGMHQGMQVQGMQVQGMQVQGMEGSALICPITGGQHLEKSRPGAWGIAIGVLCCPIGFIAVIFDQKVTCEHCNHVIKEAWGGC
ncbi:hypothetical protein CspHIS471_0108310 [Cutaneotrichosporon sp. HIS471]|nr:hypothetical protein CspHIS471_0108310 [Cutaneotrichosporon sp. HIS471]